MSHNKIAYPISAMDLEAQESFENRRRRLVVLVSIIVTQLAYYYHLLLISTVAAEPIPYHTSILTGQAWMIELLNGHPDRIRLCLGVKHDVFDALIGTLKQHGHAAASRNGILLEEQLGIFLYTCVTGLSTGHIAERFQHSGGTITRSVFFIPPPLFILYSFQILQANARFLLHPAILLIASSSSNHPHPRSNCHR